MRTALALAALLLLPACGTERSPAPAAIATPVERPDGVPAPGGEVTTGGPVTVLDDGGGAELCLGGVATSLPPQCGGPPLVGWDWSEHAGDFEDVRGVRWGEFVVTGAFDGTSMTPAAVVPAAAWTGEHDDSGDHDFTTPCEEPEGGWVVDAGRTSQGDQDRAFGTARRLRDYAYSFIDTSPDGRSPEEMDQDALAGDLDASRWIVNVRVTGDPAAAQDALREVWGGGLCVLGAQHTDAELGRIQQEVHDLLPGTLSSGRGLDQVEVGVVFDDGTIQAWVDQQYGTGTVVVGSALEVVG
ncbi:hypothetical protein [Nocardioides pyridinolyticus]